MELARQAPRVTGRTVLMVAFAAAFVVLATLVVAGALTGFDQYSLDHWMPALSPGPHAEPPGSVGLYRPFSWNISWWQKVLDTWPYPGSVLLSALIFAIGGLVLVRRGRARGAAIWFAAWVAGNGIEVVGKEALDRDPLYGAGDNGERFHVPSFDSSFPSGHMVRSILVAALLIYLWPRLTRPVLVWGLLVPPALVASAAHVPTDVIAGAFLGLLVVLAVHSALESRFVDGVE